jgi:hypothetical protein
MIYVATDTENISLMIIHTYDNMRISTSTLSMHNSFKFSLIGQRSLIHLKKQEEEIF